MADRELTEHELREEEERRQKGRPSLDEEIAQKYDPQRLQKLVVRGAGRGEKLDLATRSEMERMHPGHDFGNVRVFRGAFAEEITSRNKADAVTIANTGMILVRESARSAPGTTAGKALIAHEVAHVAQAQRGMHFALAHEQGQGPLEHEAEHYEGMAGQQAKQEDPMVERLKEETRRRAITEKAFDLLSEDHRLQSDRCGTRQDG